MTQLDTLERLAFQVGPLSGQIHVGVVNKKRTAFVNKVNCTADVLHVVADYLEQFGETQLLRNERPYGYLKFVRCEEDTCWSCGEPAEPGMIASFTNELGETHDAPCCMKCGGK